MEPHWFGQRLLGSYLESSGLILEAFCCKITQLHHRENGIKGKKNTEGCGVLHLFCGIIFRTEMTFVKKKKKKESFHDALVNLRREAK